MSRIPQKLSGNVGDVTPWGRAASITMACDKGRRSGGAGKQKRSGADRFGHRLRLHGLDHRIGELRGAGLAAYVTSQLLTLAVNLLQPGADAPGRVVLAQV